MGQERGLDGQPGVFPLSDRFAEMGSIPLKDDGGEQVEHGHAVVLALARAVADFAFATKSRPVSRVNYICRLASISFAGSPPRPAPVAGLRWCGSWGRQTPG